MEPFTKALEVVARVMRDGAALSIIWAAPKNICASGATAISCRTMCHMQRRGY